MSKMREMQKKFIITEVSKLFLNDNIDNVTMSQIAKYVEVGDASIYRYFGKKETLVIMVATNLWKQIKDKFFIFDELLKDRNGYEKVSSFFYIFVRIYNEEKGFLRFINEFDNYVIEKKIPKSDLVEYDKEIMSIKEVYDRYHLLGIEDGTIKEDVDKDVFYFTTSHSLLGLCEKFSSDQIIYSDSIIDYSVQIKMMIDMALKYIKKV